MANHTISKAFLVFIFSPLWTEFLSCAIEGRLVQYLFSSLPVQGKEYTVKSQLPILSIVLLGVFSLSGCVPPPGPGYRGSYGDDYRYSSVDHRESRGDRRHSRHESPRPPRPPRGEHMPPRQRGEGPPCAQYSNKDAMERCMEHSSRERRP